MIRPRLLQRSATSRSLRWYLPLLAIVVSLVVVSLVGLVVGANPWSVCKALVWTPFASDFRRREVLVAATPLLYTGCSIAIAFRGGFYNIGAEGQLLAGAIGAAWVGQVAGGWPSLAALPAMALVGATCGAVWIAVPAMLKTFRGIDEVVTTLMLNPVALLLVSALLNGPWKDPETGFPESPRIAGSTEYPRLFYEGRIHLGIVIALAVMAASWFIISRTLVGLRYRAIGAAPKASHFSGMPVAGFSLGTAFTSGAIAGLAGVSEVAGIQFRLTQGLSGGAGFTGIVAATLGGLSVAGSQLAALLLGAVRVGSQTMSRTLDVPSQLGDLFTGVVLLVMASSLIFQRFRLVWTSSKSLDETVKVGAVSDADGDPVGTVGGEEI